MHRCKLHHGGFLLKLLTIFRWSAKPLEKIFPPLRIYPLELQSDRNLHLILSEADDKAAICSSTKRPVLSDAHKTHTQKWRILSGGQEQIQHVGHHKYKEGSFLVNGCNQPFVFTSAAAKESKQSVRKKYNNCYSKRCKTSQNNEPSPPFLKPWLNHQNTPRTPNSNSLCPLQKGRQVNESPASLSISPPFSLPHLFIEAAAPFDLYACGMCVRGPAAVRADGEGGE